MSKSMMIMMMITWPIIIINQTIKIASAPKDPPTYMIIRAPLPNPKTNQPRKHSQQPNFTPFEMPTPSSRRGGTAQVIPDDDCVNKIGAEVNVLFIVGLMCTNDGKTCIDGVLCNRYGLEVFVKCGNARDDLLSESLILKGTDYVIAVERVYCSVQTS